MGASSPLLSCPSKPGHVGLKNPRQGIQLCPGNSCPRSHQRSGEKNGCGEKESQSISPLLLSPCMTSAPRPALGQGPVGPNLAPAVRHETGSQVSSSACCVSRVQTDGVRGPQRLLLWGVLRCGCASESRGACSDVYQSLRKTADTVY